MTTPISSELEAQLDAARNGQRERERRERTSATSSPPSAKQLDSDRNRIARLEAAIATLQAAGQ